MTAEVVFLNVDTTLPVPCERVLNAAISSDLKRVIVLGVDHDNRPYFAASHGDNGDNLILVEQFKDELMKRSEWR